MHARFFSSSEKGHCATLHKHAHVNLSRRCHSRWCMPGNRRTRRILYTACLTPLNRSVYVVTTTHLAFHLACLFMPLGWHSEIMPFRHSWFFTVLCGGASYYFLVRVPWRLLIILKVRDFLIFNNSFFFFNFWTRSEVKNLIGLGLRCRAVVPDLRCLRQNSIFTENWVWSQSREMWTLIALSAKDSRK